MKPFKLDPKNPMHHHAMTLPAEFYSNPDAPKATEEEKRRIREDQARYEREWAEGKRKLHGGWKVIG